MTNSDLLRLIALAVEESTATREEPNGSWTSKIDGDALAEKLRGIATRIESAPATGQGQS